MVISQIVMEEINVPAVCSALTIVSASSLFIYLFIIRIVRSDVSAMSDSDVGDQQMLITVSTNFQNFIDVPFTHAVDIQSMNVFLCLIPLARLPSIIPVSATASN